MGNYLGKFINVFFPRSPEMTKLLDDIETIREEVDDMNRQAEALSKAAKEDGKRFEAQQAERKSEETAKRNVLAEEAKSKGPESYAAFLEQEKIETEAKEIDDARHWVDTLQWSLEDERSFIDSLSKDHPSYAHLVESMADSQRELDAAKAKLAELLSKNASGGV